jgi:hypothetical protein
MSYHPGSHCGGIRTLADIKARCIVDEETGCWEWGLSYSHSKTRKVSPIPRCHILKSDGKRTLTTTCKAAWLISGRKLRSDYVVYRAVCWNTKCCNPDHLRAGTMKQMGAAISKAGVLRGNPHRVMANTRNNNSQATPREVVERAESLFAAGWKLADVAREIGVHKDTARLIRRGTHRNSTGRQAGMSLSSVFGWRGQIAVNDDEARAA